MKTKEPDPIAILSRGMIKYQVVSLVASALIVLAFYVVMTGNVIGSLAMLSSQDKAMDLLMWCAIIDLVSMYRLSQLSRRRLILTRVRMFSKA